MSRGVWQALGVPISTAWGFRRQKARGTRPVRCCARAPPTITLGRRGSGRRAVGRKRSAGIAVERVSRGGRATYHGPGQLIGYVITRLSSHGRGDAR